MVSRYIKRAQTKRLCDGETRLAPGSENESTDVLFEKTRRERVRTLLLLLFLRSTPARSSSRFSFRERRRDFNKEEEERRKDARKEDRLSLSLSFRGKTTKSAFVHSFLRAKTRSNGRKVVRNEMVSTLCTSARNKLYEKK